MIAAITGSSIPGDVHGVWSNRGYVIVVKSSPNAQGSNGFEISQL
jgi:hypothetical protein